MIAVRLGLAGALAAIACSRPSPPEPAANAPEPVMNTWTPSLAEKLAGDAFGPLFRWPAHDQTIAAIWAEGAPALEAVLDDPAAPPRAKFVAAEVMFARDFTFVGRHDRTALAQVYAAALRGNFTGHANAWGLLWANDDVGTVGGRFKMIGDASIPVLRALLDDATVVDWYVGSEEATVGNGARYRIKDFAAFYLGRMRGKPVPFHDQPADRDAEIDRLRASLPAP